MNERNLHRIGSHRQRASRLLDIARERRSVEAELVRRGCTFRGRVERRHRALSRQLDALESRFQAAWSDAA